MMVKQKNFLKRDARGAFGNFATMPQTNKIKSEGIEEVIIKDSTGNKLRQFKINMNPVDYLNLVKILRNLLK